MVGRGILGNPWILKSIIAYLENGEVIDEPTQIEKIDMSIMHLKILIDYKGEISAVKEMRKHFAWYLKGMKNSNVIKDKIFKSVSKIEIEELLENFKLANYSDELNVRPRIFSEIS